MFYTALGARLAGLIAASKGAYPDIWGMLDTYLEFKAGRLADGNLASAFNDIKAQSDADFIMKCVPILGVGEDITKAIAADQNKEFMLAETLVMIRGSVSLLDKALETNLYERIHTEYRKLAKEAGARIVLSKKFFTSLVKTAFSLEWDIKEKEKYMGTMDVAQQIANILDNKLGEPKQRQYELCHFILSRSRLSVSDIYEEFPVKAQFSTINDDERKNLFLQLIRLVVSKDALEVLCCLYLGKRTQLFTRYKLDTYATPEVQKENDVLLELGLVYRLFTSSVISGAEHDLDSECLIINPSPFMIRKWHEDRRLRKKRVTFVVSYLFEADILRLHFGSVDRSGVPRKEYNFVSIDEWYDSIKKERPKYSEALVMHFDSIKKEKSAAVKDALDKCNGIRIYSLSSDESFSKTGTLANEVANDRSYQLDTLMPIPKGLGGSNPKRKIFWLAVRSRTSDLLPTWCAGIKKVKQANTGDPVLSIHSNDIRTIDMYKAIRSGRSIRDYIRNPDKKEERQREKASKVSFSREICIWFTVQEPGLKANQDRVRCEIYVCEPRLRDNDMPQRGRGIIKDSIKRKSNLSKEDIERYVLEEYPYDYVSRGRGVDVERKSIQKIIAGIYREHLAGMPITLKTFLYIYPDIASRLEKDTCRALANSTLGNILLDSISMEDFGDALISIFPDKPVSFHKETLNTLAGILTDAWDLKHLAEDPFEKQDSEDQLNDNRRFAELRAALQKRSFTSEERTRIYMELVQRIESGSSTAVLDLGLLIRLFTGLKCNEVCALRWKDFCKVEGYEFYHFHVYAKAVDNEPEIKPFSKIVEFRCLPVSPLLEASLLSFKTRSNPDPDEYIIFNGEDPNRPLSPSQLDKRGREFLEHMGMMEENIIMVPDRARNETKKINLTSYSGDIFRSNFWYMASNFAKMVYDEICYFRGTTRDTTFGIHYCDYENPNSQAVLHAKVRRLDSLFCGSPDLRPKVSQTTEAGTLSLFKHGEKFPTQLDIEVLPDTDGICEIGLSASYGICIMKEEY